MKKLVFVFAMVVAMVASANVLKAQNYVNICGTVVGTNGVPVTVNFIDSLTGQTYSTVTDPSGNFCDSLSVQSSQGYMYAYITNCTGVTQWWGSYYNPGNLNFTVTFNYCNFLQSNLNVCVTVFNLPMNTVSVSIFANNTFHYLNFTGPGTVTLCDSFMVNGTSGTAVITMTDCNGNNISQTLQYSNGNMNLSANFNYCQVVQNFVTYCITMNNIPGGIAVPVYMYDSLAGIVDTLHFLGQGSYTICDTLTTPTFSGTLMFYYIDCNGQPQSYSFNYGPGNYSATFNWDYCPILTNCYAYWTSVYDSTNNTFYISVDSFYFRFNF